MESVNEKLLRLENETNAKVKALSKKVDSLSCCHEMIKSLKTNFIKLPRWVYWVWLVSIISLAFSLVHCFNLVFPYVYWTVETVSIGIVLGFVGILATFVVVGNYMQVKHAEDKVEKLSEKVKQLEDDMSKKIFEKVIMMDIGVKTKSFDFKAIMGTFGAEVRYTVLRGGEIQKGTIVIGNTIDSFTEINVTGECNVYFSCVNEGTILIHKNDEPTDELVIIRFLVFL